jgi:formylglycine-generating enzyme required for sulfatase activity
MNPPHHRLRACVALVGAAAFAGLACERANGPSPDGREAAPVIRTKGGVEMVLIPAGSFEMGGGRGKADEGPVHRVKLDAFLMDRTEVTQEQYEKLGLPNPSHFKGPTRPVDMVSWAQAAAFCNARSRAEGLEPCYNEDTAECNFKATGYRLPTEAEWEYACRAGGTGEYPFGDPRRAGEYAWFADNAAKKTQSVGQKQPNAWGLYDLAGNVAEWCNDVYGKDYYKTSPSENPRGPADGDKYVLRGGAWNSTADALRSTARVGETPGMQDACFARDAIGFRCVRKAPDQPAG